MPTGTGAVNLRNLPSVAYQVNPQLFFALTEKNMFAPPSIAIPPATTYSTITLLQVGVVSKIRIIYIGTVTTTGGTVTIAPEAYWPYGIFSGVTLSGNGQNNFFNCSSYDLRQREIVQNRAYTDTFFVGPVTSNAIYAAAGNAPITIGWDLPIAMDDTTLIGALYAQSEATNLTLTLTSESMANLFAITAGSIALTGTVYFQETFFDVPYNPQAQDTLVIPDLTVLHGFVANNSAVAGQSQVTTPLYRINGQLERLLYYIKDYTIGSAALKGIVPTSDYSSTQLVYGASTTPYSWTPQQNLNYEMGVDYRVAPPDGVYWLDLVKENPQRDQILLEGVTNLRLVNNMAAAYTPGAAAVVHFVQETLFA
jgi:hypothetical protein